MPLSGLNNLFWAAGVLGHIALLIVLFVRRRAVRFPFFTALIFSNVLRSLILYLVRLYGSDRAYLVAYLLCEGVDILLQVSVVYEVAFNTLRPLGRWARDVRHSMFLLVGVSLLVASALTWMAAPDRPIWEFQLVIKAGFFSSTLMSELFLGMAVLSVTSGLPWRTHVARIAHGLGVYSLLDVAIETAKTALGAVQHQELQDALTYGRKAVYLVVLVYWIVTLWRDAPQPRELSEQVREQLRSIQARLAYDLFTLRNGRKP